MKAETNKNIEEKITVKSSILPNKYLINDNIKKKTQLIEEKLYLFEKEINNKTAAFKKINNNVINSEAETPHYDNYQKSKKISNKNLSKLNTSVNLEDIKHNNEVFRNKIKKLENKMNEDKKYNQTFTEQNFPKKINNEIKSNFKEENLFSYSNFLDEKEFAKERYSLQNNKKSNFIDKEKEKEAQFKSDRYINYKLQNDKQSSKENNKINFNNSVNDINDLDHKIRTTKEKLNNCLNKTMNSIIDKRNFMSEFTQSGKKLKTKNFIDDNEINANFQSNKNEKIINYLGNENDFNSFVAKNYGYNSENRNGFITKLNDFNSEAKKIFSGKTSQLRSYQSENNFDGYLKRKNFGEKVKSQKYPGMDLNISEIADDIISLKNVESIRDHENLSNFKKIKLENKSISFKKNEKEKVLEKSIDINIKDIDNLNQNSKINSRRISSEINSFIENSERSRYENYKINHNDKKNANTFNDLPTRTVNDIGDVIKKFDNEKNKIKNQKDNSDYSKKENSFFLTENLKDARKNKTEKIEKNTIDNDNKKEIFDEADSLINNHSDKLERRKKRESLMNSNFVDKKDIPNTTTNNELENKINFIFDLFNKLPGDKIEEFISSRKSLENENFTKVGSRSQKNFFISENKILEGKNLNSNDSKKNDTKNAKKNDAELNEDEKFFKKFELNNPQTNQRIKAPFKNINKNSEEENITISRNSSKKEIKKNTKLIEAKSSNKEIDNRNSSNPFITNNKKDGSIKKNYNNSNENFEDKNTKTNIRKNLDFSDKHIINPEEDQEKQNQIDKDYISPEKNKNYSNIQIDEEEELFICKYLNESKKENKVYTSTPIRPTRSFSNLKKKEKLIKIEKLNENQDEESNKVKFKDTPFKKKIEDDDDSEKEEEFNFPQSEQENSNQKYLTSTEGIYSDIPLAKFKDPQKVKFSKKVKYINYNENCIPEEIEITDKNGKPEKHQKLNFIKYLNMLKTDRFKLKKSILYYYDGIRDDKIPKKIIASFKKKNYFSENDNNKEIGLKKLNDFLSECNIENSPVNLEEKNRNLDIIHEIEERNKRGTKERPRKSYTPKKINKSEEKEIFDSSGKNKLSNSLKFSSKNAPKIMPCNTSTKSVKAIQEKKKNVPPFEMNENKSTELIIIESKKMNDRNPKEAKKIKERKSLDNNIEKSINSNKKNEENKVINCNEIISSTFFEIKGKTPSKMVSLLSFEFKGGKSDKKVETNSKDINLITKPTELKPKTSLELKRTMIKSNENKLIPNSPGMKKTISSKLIGTRSTESKSTKNNNLKPKISSDAKINKFTLEKKPQRNSINTASFEIRGPKTSDLMSITSSEANVMKKLVSDLNPIDPKENEKNKKNSEKVKKNINELKPKKSSDNKANKIPLMKKEKSSEIKINKNNNNVPESQLTVNFSEIRETLSPEKDFSNSSILIEIKNSSESKKIPELIKRTKSMKILNNTITKEIKPAKSPGLKFTKSSKLIDTRSSGKKMNKNSGKKIDKKEEKIEKIAPEIIEDKPLELEDEEILENKPLEESVISTKDKNNNKIKENKSREFKTLEISSDLKPTISSDTIATKTSEIKAKEISKKTAIPATPFDSQAKKSNDIKPKNVLKHMKTLNLITKKGTNKDLKEKQNTELNATKSSNKLTSIKKSENNSNPNSNSNKKEVNTNSYKRINSQKILKTKDIKNNINKMRHSKMGEKEKALNEIISNVNLQIEQEEDLDPVAGNELCYVSDVSVSENLNGSLRSFENTEFKWI